MASSQGQNAAPAMEQQGPPYLPQTAGLGGLPTTHVDVPISAVVLAFFIASAVLNMSIFQINKKRGIKFVLSAVVFGFSMARITANVLRIVWACYPHNTRIAIAANVLANAGVLLLFIVNLILALRIVRAHHPTFGWSRPFSLGFRSLYFSVGACLVMMIVSVVYGFYTLDAHVHSQLRDIQLTAVVYLTILAFLPLPLTILAVAIPSKQPVDNFGQGSMRTKVGLILFTSTLLTLGAAFRTGVTFMVRPANHPAWFHHKAAFYCFNFGIELIVVFTYALNRFDRRFHIPNGSHAPGDYSRGVDAEKPGAFSSGRLNDEETLAGEEPPSTDAEQRAQEHAWESHLQNDLEKRESVSV